MAQLPDSLTGEDVRHCASAAVAANDARSETAERLQREFDCVVMLTWSQWHTEPRSNRYHYATRFARLLPVVFVQPFRPEPGYCFEETDIPNFTLLHLASRFGEAQSAMLDRALRERGVMRPLFWVYCPSFVGFLKSRTRNPVVYHATEDFFSMTESIRMTGDSAVAELRELFCRTDLVIAVSEGVRRSYLRNGCTAPILTVPNGCDFDFWRDSGASAHAPPEHGRPVALYQGGVNTRLDYPLLQRLTELLPDWEFWFCGMAREDLADWQRLRAQPNLRYLGVRPPEEIPELARAATVGIIPFVDVPLMRISWPLKAFEYVACGLPVVTTPIDALTGFDDLFVTASTAEEFAAAMTRLAPSRRDPAAIDRRLACARGQSYDLRFATVIDAILARIDELKQTHRLNVLLLAGGSNAGLEALKAELAHNVFRWPAFGGGAAEPCPVAHFDAVLCGGLPGPEWTGRLQAFRGLKVLLLEDEAVDTAALYERIEEERFDVVYGAAEIRALDLPAVEFRHLNEPAGLAPDIAKIIRKYIVAAPRAELSCVPVARRWRGDADFEPVIADVLADDEDEGEEAMPAELPEPLPAVLPERPVRAAFPVLRRLAREMLRPLPDAMQQRLKLSLVGALARLGR